MVLTGVIFDLDGTLVNTLPVCFAAFRRAFRQFLGRDYSDAEIEATFGPSEEGAIQRLVPTQWEACYRVFLQAYEEEHHRCTAPFSGILEMLGVLYARNIPTAVVTGKGAGSAEISLRRTGLSDYFEIVEVGSAQGGIKPAAIGRVLAKWEMEPTNVAYVGDAVSDIPAANEAGVIPVAAAWAATAHYERLREQNPAFLFTSVAVFRDWLLENT